MPRLKCTQFVWTVPFFKRTIRLLLLLSLLEVVLSMPHSYQHVKFLSRGSDRVETSKWKPITASPRNFPYSWPSFPNSANRLWSISNFHIPSLPQIDQSFEFLDFIPSQHGFHGHNEHISPDFSNGLDIPDPYLLTGIDAYNAVKYLYGRGELFFGDYPHIRALLRNQKQRRENHLEGNRLSSSRINSPFYRE